MLKTYDLSAVQWLERALEGAIAMSRLGSLACVLVLTACAARHTPPVQRTKVQPAQLYQQGLELAQAGDLTRAEQSLASALRAGYDERAATKALVGVCVRASHLRSAVTYVAAYLTAHPGDIDLRRLLATLHWALGEPLLAEDQLARVLTRDPNDPDAHFMLGLVLSREATQAQRARQHYSRYLQLAPEGAHAQEARAALSEGREPKQEGQLVRAARLTLPRGS